MSRDLQAAVTSAAQLPAINFRLLVEVQSLSTGVTRACNGQQAITYAGNTYSPVGTLGGIEKIQEDSSIFPRAVRLWFAAVSTQQIQDVVSESMFNCPVIIRRGFLTDSLTLVASAELLWSGFINACEMRKKDPQRGNYFEIEAESRLLRPPRAQYFDRETLWTIYAQSGDRFFNYLSKVPLTRVNWGTSILEGYGDPLPNFLRPSRST